MRVDLFQTQRPGSGSFDTSYSNIEKASESIYANHVGNAIGLATDMSEEVCDGIDAIISTVQFNISASLFKRQ